jgi:hypothetical protein
MAAAGTVRAVARPGPHGGVVGLVAGYLFALVTNLVTSITKMAMRRRVSAQRMWDVLEYI